ncbi:hypothetical protein AX761_21790 [Rhizobium sp. 58]|nr:hypothetical protein AX761_21790 [Rhizobium sp. 58]
MASSWKDVVAPLARKFELAHTFNGEAAFNAEGCKAMAALLKQMARIIDEEIEARNKPPVVKLTAWEKLQVFMTRAFNG